MSRPRPPLWQRALPWLVTIVCFAWLGNRIAGAAARQGETVASYLMNVFASVSWGYWLALMVPYSTFFFLVDSTVVWRVFRDLPPPPPELMPYMNHPGRAEP